jgi:DNA-binding PadR family transcriptional regulator
MRSMDPQHLDRFLPLKPVVFHILLALSEEESHGYGVIQSVRERSEGRIHLQTGAFYRHLRRLLDDGLVEELEAPVGDDPRRGIYYGLTDNGRHVVRAEWRRMADLVAATQHLGAVTEERPA